MEAAEAAEAAEVEVEAEAEEEEYDQVHHLSLFFFSCPRPRPAPPPPAPPAMIKKQAVVTFCSAFDLFKYLVQSCRRHEGVKDMVFKNWYVMQGKI